MPRSKAQKFAQNRNRAGGTLKGVIVNLRHNIRDVCTEEEKFELDKAFDKLQRIEDNWRKNYENAKQELL